MADDASPKKAAGAAGTDDGSASAPDTRRSSIQHFSLLNSLLAVINTESPQSTDAVLARYFLENFHRIGKLNVYDVAEECFTSRSGVRRFCQSIGLDNFSDLKSYSWEWDRHRAQYVGHTNHEDFREYLASSIDGMIDQINKQVDDATLDDLAYLLHDASTVVLLTSDFSSMTTRQFQQSMVYLEKIVNVVTDTTHDVSRLASLGLDDAVIVISERGNYARAVLPLLENLPVPRALVTADAEDALLARFDYAVRLSGQRVAQAGSVFEIYGMAYFFDLLYHRYYQLFATS
ncbi:MAG: MurR/RpiR family transcriptional regulator [Tractidigestivibacter sp.]|jgi:DNA-binding MurR/RpiR family transcriptional regulator|uniref:MurR/RpiR family transcriptional regulator n=1 Tax=Tractidigestivibacter sp. TaxID=2847320 RepID=UPI003D90B872